jgi:MFS family permease
MLPLELCSNRVVVLGSLGSFTIGAIMMGVSGFLPTYVQGVMGCSATAAGIVLGAMSVSWAVASVVAGRVMVRTTYRLTAIFGGLALVLGSAVLVAMTPARGPVWAGVGALLVGVGMGFCNTTYLVSAQAAVSWQKRGTATSANLFMRIVGQSTGAALFGAVLNSGVFRHTLDSGDMVDRLIEPALRRGLGGAEIAQLTAAMAAALENVYVICALLGIGTLVLGAGLPARLRPVPSGRD